MNAEDASFFPSVGAIVAFERPPTCGSTPAIETGSVVGTDYDSMIAKVIVHGDDRAPALARLERALAAHHDPRRDAPTWLPAHAARARGRARGRARHRADRAPRAGRAAVRRRGRRARRRLAGAGPRPQRRTTRSRAPTAGGSAACARRPTGAVRSTAASRSTSCSTNKGVRPRPFARLGDGGRAGSAMTAGAGRSPAASAEDVHHAGADGDLRAPMPGQVLLVPHAEGDEVEARRPVVVLESMKMELSLVAPVDGSVTGARAWRWATWSPAIRSSRRWMAA